MYLYKIFFILVLILSSCSSIEKIKGDSKAHTAFLQGEAYYERERYDDALNKFNIVKNKYPYSEFALISELRIADSYFKKGEYLEANRLYLRFSELNPTIKERPYAFFMAALSIYKMVPSSIDKDISLAKRAIDLFDRFLILFPNSEYYDEAKTKQKELRIKQARRIIYIAEFYKKKNEYKSSLNRYLSLYEAYMNLGFDEDIIYNIYYNYKKLNDIDNANIYKTMYNESYKNGKYKIK